MSEAMTQPVKGEPVSLGYALIAGVAAALAVNVFESLLKSSPLADTAAPTEPPPTEKLADKLYETVNGEKLPGFARQAAGMAVHYATGAALGVTYARLARHTDLPAAEEGAAFGLGVWIGLEEIGLSLLGLKPPPWQTKASAHVLAAASHLVFGLTLAGLIGARSSESRSA